MQVSDGMSVAQALLAVLSPIAVFLSTLATVFLRRHFRLLDRLEKARDREVEVLAEIALELKLSREARAENTRRIEQLEAALGKKIDDHRTSELTGKVSELTTAVQIAAASRTGEFAEVGAGEAEAVLAGAGGSLTQEEARHVRPPARSRPAEEEAPRRGLRSRSG